jgi:ribonucleotide reductase alpha subunit
MQPIKSMKIQKKMFERVAKHIASVEEDKFKWAKEFEEIMVKFEFVPAG